MATPTAQSPGKATEFRASWHSEVSENGPQIHEEDASSAFVADLAERLAALCVQRRVSKSSVTERAVPLPSPIDDDGASAPGLESSQMMFYTSDGNVRPLREIEADVIRLAISHYQGRMSEVARRLNISRSTLYRKLDDLGIDHTSPSCAYEITWHNSAGDDRSIMP